MKFLLVALIAGLFTVSAQAKPENSVEVYKTNTSSMAEAQALVDAINNRSIKVCKFDNDYRTTQKAFKINFFDAGTTTHINGKGQIVMKESQGNTFVRVSCRYK